MPLDRYREKRDFTATSEPDGAPTRGADGSADAPHRPVFVVQKHAASRLHYDFRLEIDGVLASWAVPKGPSLDPHMKRLAVHVEDHPLDYGGFEGTIPQGEYGGGTVMLWDRGTFEPLMDPATGLAKGDFKFVLHGEKLSGRFVLVRMRPRPGEKSENWLLIKERDEHVRSTDEYDVTTARPESVASGRDLAQIADSAPPVDTPASTSPAPIASPGADPLPVDAPVQLATLSEVAPEGPEWIREVKYDGYRLRIALDNGTARLLTRNGADWTDRFASLARAAERLPVSNALLDGEAVVLNADGVSDFGALQASLADKDSSRITYMAFDLLHLNGNDLRKSSVLARKEQLASLLGVTADLPAGSLDTPLRYAAHVIAAGDAFHRSTCDLALEGSVSKRADRPYISGRTRDWIKVKCLKRQEFVVGGFTDPGGARTGFGALLLGTRDPSDPGGALRYVGRVGTGFSNHDLTRIRTQLDALATPKLPFDQPPRIPGHVLHGVRPQLVAEVTFQEWTADGHLRHPSFKGLRTDKPADEVVLETPLAATSPATLTNPEKVLFPESGTTKADLARYYTSVAPAILPHLIGRPLTLVRCPHGREGNCFYQKHPDMRSLPAALRTVKIAEKSGLQTYLHLDTLEGLLALVQLGTLEIHAWNSLVGDPERPDRVVFDLDPGPNVLWPQIRQAALTVRDALDALGLPAYLKTTGGKGLHIVTPIVADGDHNEVRAFARALVGQLAQHDPSMFTAKMAKDARGGLVFLDYLRNAHGATAVAAFSTRARTGATVSVPITWDELTDDSDPQAFNVRSVPDRLAALGDTNPWEGYEASRTALSDEILTALGVPRQERMS